MSSSLEKRLRSSGKVLAGVFISAHVIDMLQSVVTGNTFLQYLNPQISDSQAYTVDLFVIGTSLWGYNTLRAQDHIESYSRRID